MRSATMPTPCPVASSRCCTTDDEYTAFVYYDEYTAFVYYVDTSKNNLVLAYVASR